VEISKLIENKTYLFFSHTTKVRNYINQATQDKAIIYKKELLREIIKKNHPELKIKAFTAAEIFFFAKLTKNSVKEVLSRLKDSGLDSLPGGGAELFHPEIREKIARGKCSGDEWLDTMEQAHNLGIKSNATMLYGHIERPEHIVDHLLKIRNLQKKTGGFLTLIPLKFSLENTELEQKNMLTHECSSIYDLKIIALSFFFEILFKADSIEFSVFEEMSQDCAIFDNFSFSIKFI